MKYQSNAQTKEEPFYGAEMSGDQITNIQDAADDDTFDESEGLGLQERPSNVQTRYSTVSERARERFGGKGVAQDVYEKTRQMRAATSAQSATASQLGIASKEEQASVRASLAARMTARNKGVVGVVKKGRGLIGWGMLAPVGTAYLFQLIFGIISLIGFGLFAAIKEFKGTWYGSIVSWVVDLEKFLPAETLGHVFWGLATLLVIGVFLACIIVFYLTGVDAFGSVLSFFIASLALALSMLPVTNLFPWLLLWVLYIKVTSTAALFSP